MIFIYQSIYITCCRLPSHNLCAKGHDGQLGELDKLEPEGNADDRDAQEPDDRPQQSEYAASENDP